MADLNEAQLTARTAQHDIESVRQRLAVFRQLARPFPDALALAGELSVLADMIDRAAGKLQGAPDVR